MSIFSLKKLKNFVKSSIMSRYPASSINSPNFLENFEYDSLKICNLPSALFANFSCAFLWMLPYLSSISMIFLALTPIAPFVPIISSRCCGVFLRVSPSIVNIGNPASAIVLMSSNSNSPLVRTWLNCQAILSNCLLAPTPYTVLIRSLVTLTIAWLSRLPVCLIFDKSWNACSGANAVLSAILLPSLIIASAVSPKVVRICNKSVS